MAIVIDKHVSLFSFAFQLISLKSNLKEWKRSFGIMLTL